MRKSVHVSNAADLVTSAEAAPVLGVSVPTVNRYAASGRLRYVKKLPGRTGAYLFHREEIEAERQRRAAA
jgi:excisionase family DNA binding protein